MKRAERVADLLLLGLLSIAVSTVASQALLTALWLDGMEITLLYCAGFTLLWAAMLYNGVTTLLLLLAPALLGFYSFMSFLWSERFPAVIDYEAVLDFLQWCREYIMTLVPADEGNLFILRLLVCGLTALLVYVFTVKRFSFTVVFFAGMGIFVTQNVMNMRFSFGLFTAFVGLSLLYWLLKSQRRAGKRRERASGAAGLLLCGLPLTLLVVLLAGRLPVPGEPLRSPALEDAVYSGVAGVFQELVIGNTEPSGTFSLAQTGFGSVTNLGSRPVMDNTLVMTVQSEGRTYLKGQVKDVYNGRAWRRSVYEPVTPLEDGQSYSLIRSEFVQMLTNAHLFWWMRGMMLAPDWAPYMMQSLVKITYGHLPTRQLFLPSGTVALVLPGDSDEVGGVTEENGGTVSAGDILPFGYSYSAITMITDYKNETLQDFLKQSRKGLYREMGDVFPISSPEPIPLNLLETYADEAYEYGLQIPDQLPERVRDLAAEITGPYDNRYEQAKAIERYVAENFTYTLTPRRAPLGRDYVDFLLFDSKEGFCTHFATTMAVLCRAAGIPARIAEGYVLLATPTGYTPEGLGNYDVTNQQAHAWVEVYFEGIGWLPFEPTAPYAALLYDEPAPVTYSEEFLSDPEAAAHRDFLEEFGNELPEPTVPVPPTDTPAPRGSPGEKEDNLPGWLLWILAAALAALGAFLGLRLLRRRREKRFARPPRESVPSLFERTLQLLRILQLRRAPSETLSEFAGRVQRELNLPEAGLLDVVERYLPVRYGGKEPDEEDREGLLRCNRTLEETAKRRLGRTRWVLLRLSGLL